MQSNLSFPFPAGSSEKFQPWGRGGFSGFIRALWVTHKENKKRIKEDLPPEPPYGIRMYVGLPGSGKTISMVQYLIECQQKYPGIKVFTNFGYKYEDAPITKMSDFLHLQNEQGIIFAVDEIQLSFQSRQYNSFPPQMIFTLTQNRKFRKHFVCTAQLYEHVDKVFRDLTNHVIDCHGYFGRAFYQKAWAGIDYKRKALPTWLETGDEKSKHLWKRSFYATDELFACYDTLRVVDSFAAFEEQDKTSKWNNSPDSLPQVIVAPK